MMVERCAHRPSRASCTMVSLNAMRRSSALDIDHRVMARRSSRPNFHAMTIAESSLGALPDRLDSLRLADELDAARAVALDPALRSEVLAGLARSQKGLPPKLFYDAIGAELFERICELDEYYVTRAELSILRAHAGEIAAAVGPRAVLIEYGSGAGMKVRLLLAAMAAAGTPFEACVPIDISREQLVHVASDLAMEYPLVPVLPMCA